MEFLKAGAIAGLVGCGATVVIALFLMVVAVKLWSGIDIAPRGFLLILIGVGVRVVPVSVFLGLVYAAIRLGVRAGMDQGR